MTLQQGFGFEPGWTWIYNTEVFGAIILNPNNEAVAKCCNQPGNHWYTSCGDITQEEDCIARGIARINLGTDIPLSPQSTTKQ